MSLPSNAETFATCLNVPQTMSLMQYREAFSKLVFDVADSVIAGYRPIIRMWRYPLISEITLSLSLIHAFMESSSKHSYAHNGLVLQRKSGVRQRWRTQGFMPNFLLRFTVVFYYHRLMSQAHAPISHIITQHRASLLLTQPSHI